MQIDITHRPGNSAAKVTLQAGESITAEGGAMIAMSGHMQVETTTHKKGEGSILGALKLSGKTQSRTAFGILNAVTGEEVARIDQRVTDAESGEPLGVFYLDLFPRPGKYNHFAQFDVISGRTEPDGRRRAPVAALVCNFTPGVDGEPPLMTSGQIA